MDFATFLEKTPSIQTKKLGGLEAQFKLAPAMRLGYSSEKIKAKYPKKAAVLALFYPNKDNETCFLLTQRAQYKGTHSAQISFPGGKVEATDATLKDTALRESFEEVGIAKEAVTVLREMTDVYIPPSNFLATPFIGISLKKPTFTSNHEVAQLLEIPVSALLQEANITFRTLSTSYATNIEVPCFQFKDIIVWGATAMMLSEIKELLR